MKHLIKPLVVAAAAAVAALAALGLWLVRAPRPQPRPLPGGFALYVVENVPDRGAVREKRLMRYPFRAGDVGAATVVGTYDAGVFGPGGGTRLVNGRHLVTRSAGVIDLRDGRLVHDERLGEIRGVAGGKVYFQLGNRFDGFHYFAFDLASRKPERLAEPAAWALPGVVSPGGTRSAVEVGGSGVKIHEVGKPPRLLGDDFHVNYSKLASTFGRPPLLWLDDERLLTQTGNGRLVVVRAADGSRSAPISVAASRDIVAAPRLWLDAAGEIIYECGPAFRIDVKGRRGHRYEWRDLGHGFEASMTAGGEGHVLRHEGVVIGRRECVPAGAAVTEGHMAVAGGPAARGVWVWSAVTCEWTMLPAWPEAVVGWVRKTRATVRLSPPGPRGRLVFGRSLAGTTRDDGLD